MRFLKYLIVAAVVGALALYATGWYLFERAQVPMPAGETVRVQVPSGATVRSLARSLNEQHVYVDPRLLLLRYRLRGLDGKLKAGTFELKPPQTIDSLLDHFVSGDVLLQQLRITEGWTFRQMRELVDAHPDIRHDTAGLSDAQLMERIGATQRTPEGLFMPDTYSFSPGASDLDIYRRAYRLLQERLELEWKRRPKGSPLRTPYEALVLASIVEKETGHPEDRNKVAAVFLNRLGIGMMLQSDPTTIYGMGDRFDGNLRRSDLRADTPFNTYTRNGLPPTPIALVSAASLRAVFEPAHTKALYFVARGDGTSEFSNTLADHNRAVARYQLGRK